ncbi:MAG: helix-hairpin-helix domain-containing protein [Deltaproteobacteria bacterium]|nr:helix-hairpin-helix domain-containing protein [Deltaproteobacteria bacterium]
MRLRAFLAVALAVLVGAGVAHAAPYEVEIHVETEEDLYELLASEQISEDTFHALLELMRRGVDLSRAGRDELYALPNISLAQVEAILAYRRDAGGISNPADLVGAGVLSPEELGALAPFLVIRKPKPPRGQAVDGWIRSPAMWTTDDGALPTMALQARAGSFRHLTAGTALVLTRNRLGEVAYDAGRDSLSARPPEPTLHVPKLFVQWDTGKLVALAGSYRAGFGTRLTFDNTDRVTPNGFYPDDTVLRGTDLVSRCKESKGELAESPCVGEAGDTYVTPDYRWRDSLLGVAVGARKLGNDEHWLQAFGFMSVGSRSIYQYELYDRRRCVDPHDDKDLGCAAPPVYRWQEDTSAPTSRYSYQTLPGMFRELLAGGNVAAYAGRRAHLGLTAYGATVRFGVPEMELDFQEWSRLPRGGPFGAVGMDAAWGRGLLDFSLEATRSFDSMGGPGGGFGGLLRSTVTWPKNEIELSLRAYGRDFANPYAGAISAADEFDGSRVRDERGVRLKATNQLGLRTRLRALLDAWAIGSGETSRFLAFLRADHRLTDRVEAGSWVRFQDKDLGAGGRGQCFESTTEESESGEPVPCAGQQVKVAGLLRVAPHRRVALAVQAQHSWVDDSNKRYSDEMRRDLSTWFTATVRPIDTLRLRARIRYLSQGLAEDDYLEESIWGYADVSYRVPGDFALRLRYDLYVLLDDRDSSRGRGVQNWVLGEVEARF